MNKFLSFPLVLCVACHARWRSLTQSWTKTGPWDEGESRRWGWRTRDSSKYGSSSHFAYLVSVYRVLLLQLAFSESLVLLLKLLQLLSWHLRRVGKELYGYTVWTLDLLYGAINKGNYWPEFPFNPTKCRWSWCGWQKQGVIHKVSFTREKMVLINTTLINLRTIWKKDRPMKLTKKKKRNLLICMTSESSIHFQYYNMVNNSIL